MVKAGLSLGCSYFCLLTYHNIKGEPAFLFPGLFQRKLGKSSGKSLNDGGMLEAQELVIGKGVTEKTLRCTVGTIMDLVDQGVNDFFVRRLQLDAFTLQLEHD